MSNRMMLCALLVGVQWAGAAVAEDWRQFRGPGGLGTSQEKNLPTEWSQEKNLRWRTELPGPGSSSPITVGDRIYLTCYTGYGEQQDDPGNMDDLQRHLVCLRRKSGAVVWVKTFNAKTPVGKYQGNGARHGYSTSTPISDGKRLYVFFGATGFFCFDLEGNEIWRADLGGQTHNWGSATSPVLYKNLVIAAASVESRSLVALDKTTGKEIWRKDGARGCWNTPVLLETTEGGFELVYSIPERVIAISPDTGEELWSCNGIPDRGYICPSVIAHDGIVYAIGGRKNTAIAIRAGGRGDVTETHELWRTGRGSNVASPIYHDGHIYWVHESRGVAYCLNAATGEVVYEERLSPRPGLLYASATLADGKIYCVSQNKGAYVLAAIPKFQLLAHNTFADDDSRSNASPVVDHGRLLLRSDRYLYCLERTK